MIPVELILLLLSPLFVGFIAWEWYRTKQAVPPRYRWQDTLANAVLALLHQGSDMLALLLLMPFFLWLYQFRWFDIELTAGTVAVAFLLQDFLYYWFHRASHHIRWLWASHVTHHSSRLMNFSTALRQSLTYPLSGMWLFWTPMIIAGFSPTTVFAVVALNLAFQFFVHTQAVRSLGVLDWLFNTPSHHRVHHACNPLYIDKNFGGVLIIWERLFGSFVAERDEEPCRYGITDDFQSDNPLTITFHEWRRMWRDCLAQPSLGGIARSLFGAPVKPPPATEQKTLSGG